jgi:K(+)-stimulated pyrophosphate-energized sodium pump
MVMQCPCGNAKMQEIAAAIQEGSKAFLVREYTWLSVFVAVTTVVMCMVISPLTGLAFVIGAFISGTPLTNANAKFSRVNLLCVYRQR